MSTIKYYDSSCGRHLFFSKESAYRFIERKIPNVSKDEKNFLAAELLRKIDIHKEPPGKVWELYVSKEILS